MKVLSKPSKFISEVSQEMSKVSWPTYDDLKSSTIIVVVLSLILTAYIFASDYVLNNVIKLIF